MESKTEVDIRDRDERLLRALYESRFLMYSHIAALFFDGKKPAAQKRVYKLKRAGFLREQSNRKLSELSRVSLTRQALEYLTAEGLLAGYPRMRWESLAERLDVKPTKVDHERTVLDVRVSLEGALQEAGLTLVEFSTWPRLFTFQLSPHPNPPADGTGSSLYQLEPDALLRFASESNTAYTYFIEVDRSSENRRRLLDKALGYKALQAQHQHLLKTRLGMSRDSVEPVRIAALFIFQSRADGTGNAAMSRNNFIELVCAKTSMEKLIYAATYEDVRRDPLGKIWLRPKEYRAALTQTNYDPADLPARFIPTRRPERDRLIRESDSLVNLFGQ